MMNELTERERELVALGAALGSNCLGCIEHHVPAAREAGLTDPQISEALRLADQVRQVPARKVLDAAVRLIPTASDATNGQAKPAIGPSTARARAGCCCG